MLNLRVSGCATTLVAMVTNRRTLDLKTPFSMATETLSLILEIAVLSCEPCCDRGEVRAVNLSSVRLF